MRGSFFSPDVSTLIELFAKNAVTYLLVGGQAVIYHGYPRVTGDVDFWFEQTKDNVARLFAALHEFWDGQVPGLSGASELMEPTVVVQFGRPPHRIDLLSAIDGVTFASAWPNRVAEHLELADGRRVALPIVGFSDLVQNKRAAGRYKDLADAEQLEALKGMKG